jgi:FkbM family methyltransferase
MSLLETPEIYNFVKNILDKEGPIVFEIGTNDGTDTKEILKYCRGDFRYFAFEPDPRTADVVRALELPIVFTEAAVTNVEGKAKFYQFYDKVNDSDTGAMGPSSLYEPLPYEHWLPHLSHKEVEVDTIVLDKFCEESKVCHIDFLWIDAQGAEYNILDGGKEILKNTGWIFLEAMKNAQYKEQKTREYLVEKLSGFEIVRDWENDLLLRNKNI